MKTYYEAEDGKIFSDYSKCKTYELQIKLDNPKIGLKFFFADGTSFSAKQILDYGDLNSCEVISIPTLEALRLYQQIDNEIYVPGNTSEITTIGNYIYKNGNDERWVPLDVEILTIKNHLSVLENLKKRLDKNEKV